ncbi:MAG: TetR/AcrR family transcriptional regulator, partial [Streptomycetaceae bacterium]|nr:TetR/AcrR family transcriptional regulator [Streptomycetaceae bacterium]
LIELMADQMTGEIDVEGVPSGDWRADLTHFAHELRAMWLRHPWIATARRPRPTFGPRQLHVIERVVAILDPYVGADENFSLIAMLNNYVESTARDEAGWLQEARDSGLTESQWTARNSAYFQHIMASGDYPVFTKLVTQAHQPHLPRDAQFHHGLTRTLDYIAAALPTKD